MSPILFLLSLAQPAAALAMNAQSVVAPDAAPARLLRSAMGEEKQARGPERGEHAKEHKRGQMDAERGRARGEQRRGKHDERQARRGGPERGEAFAAGECKGGPDKQARGERHQRGMKSGQRGPDKARSHGKRGPEKQARGGERGPDGERGPERRGPDGERERRG